MSRGIINVMKTAVPGLIKIGKTGVNNFEQRMYNLEHDGYRNVTALERAFAIEVDDYDEKETLLHTIFEKSRLADTELFAVDVNIVFQLLSSFDGTMIFPKEETKDAVFDEAADNSSGRLIPDGKYVFSRTKKSDNNRKITATAIIQNGYWTLLKGSSFGLTENVGVSQKAKKVRSVMPLDKNGVLQSDFELGEVSPSFASDLVFFSSTDGWQNGRERMVSPLMFTEKRIQRNNQDYRENALQAFFLFYGKIKGTVRKILCPLERNASHALCG